MENPKKVERLVKSGDHDNALKNRIYPLEYICKFLLKSRDSLIKFEMAETLAIASMTKESRAMLSLLNSLRESVKGDEKLSKMAEEMIIRQQRTVENITRLETDISEKNPIIEDMTNMIEQAEPIIERLVMKDSLTSAYNRYFFVSNIERLFAAADSERSLNIAFIDVDDFRKIDAGYGHDIGDSVLYMVEDMLSESMDGFKDGYVIHMGGDEFVLLSLEPRYEIFVALMDAFREDVSQLKLPADENGVSESVTVSIACANSERDEAKDYLQLYQTADRRMCSAKNDGKNRIVF